MVIDWVSFSYSTEVLRGRVAAEREPEAHELFGFGAAGCISSAARWNAFAMLTVVSFTLHFSGLGGERRPRVEEDEAMF